MKIGSNFPRYKSVLKQISRNLPNRSGKFRVNHLFYIKWRKGSLVLAGEIFEGFVKNSDNLVIYMFTLQSFLWNTKIIRNHFDKPIF